MREVATFSENIRRAGTTRGRRELGAFVVEGERLVRRALAAKLRPRTLALGTGGVGANASSRDDLAQGFASVGGAVLRADDASLLRLAQGRNSGKVLALFELPAERSLSELAVEAKRSRLPGARVALVGLLGVCDPGNVGALSRTALACGVQALWCLGQSDPYDPKTVRTSLGSVFRLSIAYTRATDASLEARALAGLRVLAEVGIGSVATALLAARPVAGLGPPLSPLALLLGHEGNGLPPAVARAAAHSVYVEQAPAVDSFSVNAAAAIALHQLNRPALGPPGAQLPTEG